MEVVDGPVHVVQPFVASGVRVTGTVVRGSGLPFGRATVLLLPTAGHAGEGCVPIAALRTTLDNSVTAAVTEALAAATCGYTTQSDDAGHYTFSGVAPGTYTVVPAVINNFGAVETAPATANVVVAAGPCTNHASPRPTRAPGHMQALKSTRPCLLVCSCSLPQSRSRRRRLWRTTAAPCSARSSGAARGSR